jgi:hypothetical protein
MVAWENNEHSMLEVVIHGRDQKIKGGKTPPKDLIKHVTIRKGLGHVNMIS